MKHILGGDFFNPSQGNLNIEQVINEIIGYLHEQPEKFYDIVVGCDSSSGNDPCFPIAIVVLRKGFGGRFFLKKVRFNTKERAKFKNWKMRILEEVMLSCELALHLREKLEKRIVNLNNNSNYEFRYIHADVGENGDTKNMVKEVTGLIRGNGFEPKIKPDSYVASSVADKYA